MTEITFISKTQDDEVEDIKDVVVERVKTVEEKHDYTLANLDHQIQELEKALAKIKALRSEVAAMAATIKLKIVKEQLE